MRTRPLATALVLALTAGGGLLALAPAATAAPARAVPAVPYDVDGDGTPSRWWACRAAARAAT